MSLLLTLERFGVRGMVRGSDLGVRFLCEFTFLAPQAYFSELIKTAKVTRNAATYRGTVYILLASIV